MDDFYEDDKVSEEFYCTKSGGGCGGFMRVRINKHLNGVYEIVCPKCDHVHRRTVKDGILYEAGRHQGKVLEQLTPTPACWSKKATDPESKRRAGNFSKERNAVVLDNPQSRAFLDDREFEIWGGGDNK